MQTMRITKNGKWGILAVVAVALVAAGAAFAATQLHSSSSAGARGAFGGRVGGPGFVPRTGFYGAPGPGFGRGRPGGGLSAAATYLGLSESELFQQLQSGKTLAQIANGTSGKSAAGLIDAMVEAQQAEIDAAVNAGMLTQAMADQIRGNLEARVTAMVNGDFGPGRGFRGFGAPGGQMPQAPSSSTPPTHI
jgi:hypothetical protein